MASIWPLFSATSTTKTGAITSTASQLNSGATKGGRPSQGAFLIAARLARSIRPKKKERA